ncbi:MAG: mechanosensitive ion channel [Paramuribaculum sp.]|nr:mechanosensitive ion channel [Paramuribaculum sp.]
MLAEIIPTHRVATNLLTFIDRMLDAFGLSHDRTLEEIIYIVLITLLAVLIGWLSGLLIAVISRRIMKHYNTELTRSLHDEHIFTKSSRIIPPLVILALLPLAFNNESGVQHIIERLLIVYTLVMLAIALNSILNLIWQRFDAKDNTKNLPLKGILYICQGLVWIIITIISMSVLLHKSPAVLLTGLGAFAAALMLIFKDSILGFVAGIQLSQNDMLRVGDWIVVPSTIANGIVVDVSLTAVKVQNWDNTIVTLPPYTLVSTSFQNWRPMQESGWRLISRSMIFDSCHVTPCTQEQLTRVSVKYPEMKVFIDQEIQSGKVNFDPGVACVNGTTETNLGLFRAYMCQYLLQHPLVAKDQQILVRIMTPEASGIPLQIYCYTSTAWTEYEAVQSQIFEHICAVCPDFDLQIYNYPSAIDLDEGMSSSEKSVAQNLAVGGPAK